MTTACIDFKTLMIFPPGEKIADELEARGLSIESLAQFLGRPTTFVQELIEGRQLLNSELARLLEEFFEFDAVFWLNKEKRFRAQLAEYQARLDARQARAKLLDCFPCAVRRQLGLSRFKGDTEELIDKIQETLRINDIEILLNEVLCPPTVSPNFRTTQHPKTSETWRNSWLICARALALSQPPLQRPFDRQKLVELAAQMPRYTLAPESMSEFLQRLEQEAGTRFLVFKHFDRTRIDGACFWARNGEPVIVYTQRYKRLDHFWFTLAHEIAHVVLHLNDSTTCFVDEDQTPQNTTESRETEANDQAAEWLLTSNIRERLAFATTPPALLKAAESIGIHPAILTGAARHAGIIGQTHYRSAGNKAHEPLNANLDEKVFDPWRVEVASLVIMA